MAYTYYLPMLHRRPAAAAVSYPLDLVTGASAGWANVKLRAAYAGDCWELDNGLTTQAIGFDGQYADEAAALSFAGVGSAGLRTWYDQSGNGFDLGQTTVLQQPGIVTLGALAATIDGRAAVNFDGAGDFLRRNEPLSSFVTASAGTVICVFVVDAINTAQADVFNNDAIWSCEGAFLGTHFHSTTPSVRTYNFDGSSDQVTQTVATGTVYMQVWRHTGGNLDSFLNSSTPSATTASGNTSDLTNDILVGVNNISVGGVLTSYFDGRCVAVLMYDLGLTDGEVDSLGDLFATLYGVTWS